MKKVVLMIGSVILFCDTFAQGYTTISTPTNVNVEAFSGIELSEDQLAKVEADAAGWIKDYDSDAKRVAPASGAYNSHGFAWHLSDGGNKLWINQFNINGCANISRYWTGTAPTYQQTTNYLAANKVFYPDGDHSATILSKDLVESKWGVWPRYQHSYDNCPYSSSNLQYFSVIVNGDDLICSSKTYSTIGISGASYRWNSSIVTIKGNGPSAMATKTVDGSGWIQVYISSPYSGTTIHSAKKQVWAGKPVINFISSPSLPVSSVTIGPFSVFDTAGSSYYWKLPSEWTIYGQGSSSVIISRPKNTYGNFTIYTDVTNSCGTTTGKTDIAFDEPVCIDNLAINPTPSGDEISINSTPPVCYSKIGPGKKHDSVIEGYLIIENSFGEVVYQLEHKAGNFTVNIQNLIPGIYPTRYISDNYILEGEFIKL